MNKTAIKSFARSAREKLIKSVKQRAALFKITESGMEELISLDNLLIINESPLRNEIKNQYEELKKEIKRRTHHTSYEEALESIFEEVAYTWFNRLITIRFMEVNDYLPIGMSLLSSSVEGKEIPDAMTNIDFIKDELNLNMIEVWKLQEKHNNNELFKYLLIQQSHQLGEMIPSAFDEIGSIEELLIPDNLLNTDSVIKNLIEEIDEEDWSEVEIIGWLYQYYQSEVKEEVGGLKNVTVSKKHLPTVTQLFTPKWIVRYMLQNTLGKLYDEKYPNNSLSNEMVYYIKDNQTPIILPNSFNDLEDLKLVDPACGSGNILLEAFELLYNMYLERGYSPREISKIIIEKNLYGFEIDKRSTQITHISLYLKAIEKNRRIIRRKEAFKFHVFEFRDVLEPVSKDFLAEIFEEEEIERYRQAEALQTNAKQYGSLLNFPDDYSNLYIKLLNFLDEEDDDLRLIAIKNELNASARVVLENAYYLSMKYDVVCTNPPYHNKFNSDLKKFMQTNFPITKSDMYSAFIEKCFKSTKKNGYAALMTPMTWMFISTHEKLRKQLIDNGSISSLVQLEYSAFEDATVPLCTFVIQKQTDYTVGTYLKLTDFTGGMDIQDEQAKQIILNHDSNFLFKINQEQFKKIPGSPIAYWVSSKFRDSFNKNKLGDISYVKKGLTTANNDKFLRFWHEVNKIDLDLTAKSYLALNEKKWVPMNKGGSFRKWFGNNDYLINWKDNGKEVKEYKGSVIRNSQFYFKECITWSDITSGNISFRYKPEGSISNASGPSIFYKNVSLIYLLGFGNSKVASSFLRLLAPTIHFEIGQISKLPLIKKISEKDIELIVSQNISISKIDWNSFENSWDFKTHPFIIHQQDSAKISDSFRNWSQAAEARFEQLKANEEELNRIFIDIYDLHDELTPEVVDKEVTVRQADLQRDVKSFLSYLVGVMFGRYSLDEPGLVYAGGEFDAGKYVKYQPDADNFIPLTHAHYFEDDIVKGIEELVGIVYGTETVEDNLQFIAEALGMKGNETSRDTIRRYFMKDFFKDHKQIYQKRPIYWQMSSGRQESFKGIFYLHRYDEATLARVRTEYVLPLSNTLNELSNQAQAIIDGSASNKEVAKARKDKEKLQKQLQEIRDYDLILKKLADQQIKLDLDDGVKVNYEKFQNIPVISSENGKEIKMNLLDKL